MQPFFQDAKVFIYNVIPTNSVHSRGSQYFLNFNRANTGRWSEGYLQSLESLKMALLSTSILSAETKI